MSSGNVESALLILQSLNNLPDERLTLRNLLIKRLQQLNMQAKNSVSLDDLLITHNIFLSNSYKPFVASSSMYMKHSVQGNMQWGTKFRIPLYFEGDFIHDMSLNIKIDGIGNPNKQAVFSDVKYRYCRFPGIRLLKKITLCMNGKVLDSYGPNEMLFYMNYELPMEKRDAFKKCVGEDLPENAQYYNVDFELNQQYQVLDGAQVFKSYQEPLSMTIPLLFWFNKDLGKSLPVLKNVNKNPQLYNQNYLEITLADINEVIQSAVYVDEPENYPTPFMKTNATLPSNIKPSINVECYSNNIFVNPEIRNFYLKNVSRYLITLYNSQSKTVAGTDSNTLLNELKEMGMTESIFFAFQPIENTKSFDKWHYFSIVPEQQQHSWYPIPVYINQPTEDQQQNVFFLDIRRATYFKTLSPIKDFTFSLDTLPLFQKMDPGYFSNYIPALSSSTKLAAPGDPGIYFIPFNRQMFECATGHVNFSKFNQIKLDWSFTHHNTIQSSYHLYISAKVIDFLIINENTVDLMENLF
jgi:hypothetical protein